MRTCTISTLIKLAEMKRKANHPACLRAAISHSRNGHAVSLEREDRMCKALGIASPKRQPRRFYRPCLPVELGEQVKLWNIDVEALLTQAVKSAILDEQWRERTHEV